MKTYAMGIFHISLWKLMPWVFFIFHYENLCYGYFSYFTLKTYAMGIFHISLWKLMPWVFFIFHYENLCHGYFSYFTMKTYAVGIFVFHYYKNLCRGYSASPSPRRNMKCIYTLAFTTLWAIFSRRQILIFLLFPEKLDLTFHANCLHWRQLAWNIKSCFLGKIREIFKTVVCWKFYPEC